MVQPISEAFVEWSISGHKSLFPCLFFKVLYVKCRILKKTSTADVDIIKTGHIY